MPPGGWDALARMQGFALEESRVALDSSGRAQAFAFVAMRPERGSRRLAAMAAVPSARGAGMAPALLDDFIKRAAQAGCERVELECFAQNARALRLYTSRGFTPLHDLLGFAGIPEGAASRDAAEVDLDDAMAWQADFERELDLPFQVTPRSLREQPAPLYAWRCGDAQCFVRETPDTLLVPALVDTSHGQRDGVELLRAMAHKYPGRTIRLPQLQRADLAARPCESAGLQRAELHQVWMTRGL
jgi:hypothetical protein